MSDNLPAKIDFTSREVINTLKQTVAVGATDAEFAMFAEQCKATGLNPFKKDIWFIKVGGRAQIMTGLNGYLAIANSHPQFDGMTVEVDNDENPTKAICKVYRKDRKYPAEGIALMKEYKKDTPIWKQMPRVMLTKVAKSIAIREAFIQELAGTYTSEEMPPEYSAKIQESDLDVPSELVKQKVVSADDLPKPERVEYTLDVKSKDFEAHKKLLKANRFMWNATTKSWVGFKRIPELEKEPEQLGLSKEFIEDEIPWDNEIPNI